MPSLLAVVPHPDDETYSFGGTLALAAVAGWRVYIVAATAGERGERHDGVTAHPRTLAAARVAELERSANELGATAVECWELPDGGLAPDDADAIERIVAAVETCDADVVLGLGADGAYGHPDHLAVYAWLRIVAERLDGVAVLFAAFAPGVFAEQHALCLSAGVLGDPPTVPVEALGDALADYEVGIASVRERKLAAIARHRTQLPEGDPYRLFPGETVSALLNVERFRDARGRPDPSISRMLATLTDPPRDPSD